MMLLWSCPVFGWTGQISSSIIHCREVAATATRIIQLKSTGLTDVRTVFESDVWLLEGPGMLESLHALLAMYRPFCSKKIELVLLCNVLKRGGQPWSQLLNVCRCCCLCLLFRPTNRFSNSSCLVATPLLVLSLHYQFTSSCCFCCSWHPGFQDADIIPAMIVLMGNFSARATSTVLDADYVGLREGFGQLARLIDTYSKIKVSVLGNVGGV